MEKNMSLVTDKTTSLNNGSLCDSGSCFSKMPIATTEQLNLAKLLSKSINETETKLHLKQVQECTACSMDEAIAALYDCDNDIQKAIEQLLDKNEDNDGWKMNTNKRTKSRRSVEQNMVANTGFSELNKINKKNPNHVHKVESVPGDHDRITNNRTSKRKFGTQLDYKNRSKKHEITKANNSSVMVNSSSASACDCNGWDIVERGDWKGEALEITNSCSNFPIDIHEDSELFKLATTEPETTETVKEVILTTPLEVTKEEEPNAIPQANENVKPSMETKPTCIKSNLFTQFAKSAYPKVSRIPDKPVVFAPNASAATRSNISYKFGHNINRSFNLVQTKNSELLNHTQSISELMHYNQHHEGNPKSSIPYEMSTEETINNIQPAINSILQTTSKPRLPDDITTDRPYASALKEAYAKLQEHDSPQSLAPNNSYDNYLIDELSQNINKINLEQHSNKTDAFTQSLSSNQPDVIAQPYHSVQSIKPSNQPLLTKPGSNLPSNMSSTSNLQSMPTSQSLNQLHPNMHQNMQTPLVSQFHPSFPMFNLHSGSSTGPQILDFEQLQAFQQQRYLFELQQQNQTPQSNSIDIPITNSCSEALPSKSNSLNHVTTANNTLRPDLLASTLNHQMLNHNTGPPFIPYPSFLVMNGYSNPFLNHQQSSQQSGSQSQGSAHGASPLTQHQSVPQQYVKEMNSVTNYQGYQNMRQSNFDGLSDLSYTNIAKQVGYKHTANQQPIYGSQLSPEIPLSNKLQQGGGTCQSNISGPQQSQQQPTAQYPHTGTQANHYTQFFPQEYLAALAAAAHAAQQQSVANPSNGVSGASNLATNSQMSSGNVNANLHGSTAMMIRTPNSVMHHQRSGQQH